jgi:peptidyl-prolyl cis-trans isomerase D
VRNELSIRQIETGLLATAFTPKVLADVSLSAFFQRREVQLVRFLPSGYASKINLGDAEIEAFYNANAALFLAPESADIEYLVLDLEAVKKSIILNEQDLRAYYDQNASKLSGKEERRASHILINAPKGASEVDRKKARERADTLLAEVRKLPESFAEVARKNSQDTGSASIGGDLEFFARGAMVKPFEDVAFALKKGEISEVVESDFGFHIIKLSDIKAPKQRSFEDLRASLEAELKTQQAQRKFAEVAEAFTNGVFEQSDALKPIAERLKLELKTATNVQRKAPEPVNGILANPKFLAAIFNAESIDKKRNTEAIELGANQLVAGRITRYTPARTIPLPDVRANVRERLVANRSAEIAKTEGEEKLASWKANTPVNLPEAVVVSRDPKQARNIPVPVVNAVLHADPSILPVWVGVDLGGQGYVVARVNKVLPREATTSANASQEQKQYAQWVAAAENQAYYEFLKDRFKVQIKAQRPVQVLDSVVQSGEQSL